MPLAIEEGLLGSQLFHHRVGLTVVGGAQSPSIAEHSPRVGLVFAKFCSKGTPPVRRPPFTVGDLEGCAAASPFNAAASLEGRPL